MEYLSVVVGMIIGALFGYALALAHVQEGKIVYKKGINDKTYDWKYNK